MTESWIEDKEKESKPRTIYSGHIIEFRIGQTVYLKTDKEQKERIVTQILLGLFNAVHYRLACSIDESYHYAIEIDDVRDIVKATNG